MSEFRGIIYIKTCLKVQIVSNFPNSCPHKLVSVPLCETKCGLRPDKNFALGRKTCTMKTPLGRFQIWMIENIFIIMAAPRSGNCSQGCFRCYSWCVYVFLDVPVILQLKGKVRRFIFRLDSTRNGKRTIRPKASILQSVVFHNSEFQIIIKWFVNLDLDIYWSESLSHVSYLSFKNTKLYSKFHKNSIDHS